MRLLLTGGHISPAISIMQLALAQSDQVSFVGRDYTSEKLGLKSRERQEVEKLGFRFYTLPYTVKFDRHHPLISFLKLPLVIPLVISSMNIINQTKPQVILTFGGYLSLPVGLAAYLTATPLILHEQTVTIGLANRLLASLATHIGIAYSSSQAHFPSSKVTVVGNPLRQEFNHNNLPKPSWATKLDKLPLLYITGGNQGSTVINQSLVPLISQLTKTYIVIHQTGNHPVYPRYQDLQKIQAGLPSSQQKRYIISPWFDGHDVAWIMSNCHLIISRSGANTINEIITSGIPSILVPLPNTHQDEQTKNAQIIATQHAGLVLAQNKLDSTTLLNSLQEIESTYPTYYQSAKNLTQHSDRDSTQKLYNLLQKYERHQN